MPSPRNPRSLIVRLPDAADAAWDEFATVYARSSIGWRRHGLQPADADDLVQRFCRGGTLRQLAR
jgi:hypothetical protein